MKKNNDKPEVILKGEAADAKIYSLLGLSKKVGFAQGGEFLTEKAVKSFKSSLILVAEDASDNTKKNFSDMCAFYKVPFYTFGTKDDLGHSIGTEFRASVTINNAGMAKKIIDLLDNK